MNSYDDKFFSRQVQTTRTSAEILVPFLLELLKPESVVDVGCGAGTWLAVLSQHGVRRILGVDGEWSLNSLSPNLHDTFVSHDLTQPFDVADRFDVAICLEVAEHIPAKSAGTLIKSLVDLAPTVVFSAAVPRQGGTHHVNEQWPDYWQSLFAEHDYHLIDCVRPLLWDKTDVVFYYAQNSFLFVHGDTAPIYARLQELHQEMCMPLRVIHPQHFALRMGQLEFLRGGPSSLANVGVRTLATALAIALKKAIWKRLTQTRD